MCTKLGSADGYCYAHQRKGLTTWTGNEELHTRLLKACYGYNVADKDLEAYMKIAGINKSLIDVHAMAMEQYLQTDHPAFDEVANRCGNHLRQIQTCFSEALVKGINPDFVRETCTPMLKRAV